MEVRVTFRSEAYIKGENLAEIKEKFENMPLFHFDSDADFVEITSVEDADTMADIKNEWDEL